MSVFSTDSYCEPDVEWQIYLHFFHHQNQNISFSEHNFSDLSNPRIDKYTLKIIIINYICFRSGYMEIDSYNLHIKWSNILYKLSLNDE